MQDVETLHREAMELVDQAVLARQRSLSKSQGDRPILLNSSHSTPWKKRPTLALRFWL
jgi:hypothetical protein